MITLILFIISMVVWVFLIKTFYDLKMIAFKFYTGSLGLFFILLFFFRPYLEAGFRFLLFYSLSFLSNLTHLFFVSKVLYAVINVNNTIFSVDFNTQTSALISMVVFTSLICFFPLLQIKRRIFLFFIGNILIFLIDILKSCLVILLIRTFSTYSLVIDFDIIGKLIFFILIITLYYVIFTKSQIKNQKVGELLC